MSHCTLANRLSALFWLLSSEKGSSAEYATYQRLPHTSVLEVILLAVHINRRNIPRAQMSAPEGHQEDRYPNFKWFQDGAEEQEINLYTVSRHLTIPINMTPFGYRTNKDFAFMIRSGLLFVK